MPQQLARIFALALIILAGVLTLHCNTTPLHAQVAEICANGIDDDGDSLIDCDDPDCSFPLFTDGGYGNSSSFDVALGDLDGDGDLDAWVANGNNQPDRVWINQGGNQGGPPGTFTDSGQELGNPSSSSVALGDLDEDGDLDAWVTNYDNQPNRVWINQGGFQGGTPGIFTDSGQALGSSFSMGVALGDLDGDGDLDSWVANWGSQPNRVWINDGLGNFTDSGQELGDSNSFAVALGDLDGDGDLDAWVANGNNQPDRVWINQGGNQGGPPGTFTDSGQELGNPSSSSVALGDLDEDGDLDAYIGNAVSEPNRVWINQGGFQGGTPGIFTDSGQALGSAFSMGVALGDLDGDGDLDAWVTNTFLANVFIQPNRVWINDGLGNFTDSGQALGSSDSNSIALGDLDGDGDLDAWVANGSTQPNRVWINQGGDQGGITSTYADNGQAQALGDLGNSREVELGDLDGDGDLDAFVANRNFNLNQIWINQGGDQGNTPGTYTDSGQALPGSNSLDVALGDLDGDSDLDAWVLNNEGGQILINQGGLQGGNIGTFIGDNQVFPMYAPTAFELGDLDGDGDLDVWVAIDNDQPNRVWINQGGVQNGTAGVFFDSGQALGNSSSFGLALGDLDGDSDLDAWVVNDQQPNRVWINQGGDQGGPPGVFSDSNQELGLAFSKSVALGDVDGDGDLDAWVANGGFSGSGSPDINRVWINQGGNQGGEHGTFIDSGQALGNSQSYDVALSDLDGDGDLDAWVANNNNQPNRVWINQGGNQGGTPGTYADSGLALGESPSQAVALGDLDGDGAPDAFVANSPDLNQSGNLSNRVWINQISCFNDNDSDGIPNTCDIDITLGADCDGNGEDDTCQTDTDSDGTIDVCDDDLDGDGIPNACDLDQTQGFDCNSNNYDDLCDIDSGLAADCNTNGIPDECEYSVANDCNSNGILDACENLPLIDCNGNGVQDLCEIVTNQAADCDGNGVPDSCQYATDPDCNSNGILDACDIALGFNDDCDGNGVPDVCDFASGGDGDGNGILDDCEQAIFQRGDGNGDGSVDISDAIFQLEVLFGSQTSTCDDAGDSNDDGSLNIADSVYLLAHLFNNAPEPPTPFPACGIDPTADALECDTYGGCL